MANDMEQIAELRNKAAELAALAGKLSPMKFCWFFPEPGIGVALANGSTESEAKQQLAEAVGKMAPG